jgi:hypothetical protein
MVAFKRSTWARHICLILTGGAMAALLCFPAWARDARAQETGAMLPLARMIINRQWDQASAYVRRQQNNIVSEIRAIVNDSATDSLTREFSYDYLRDVPTLESALLLANGFNEGGGRSSVLGLIENPRPETYPILKSKLYPPGKQRISDILLVMAQMPVRAEQRIADLKPYLKAGDFDVRIAAAYCLALLDDPNGMERIAEALGANSRDSKNVQFEIFYRFRAWRTLKFVPALIPVLNDPMPLRDIGRRYYGVDGSETAVTPEDKRYLRARDRALNLIVKILDLDVPFEIKDNVTYSPEQIESVKQQLRDKHYTVTGNPYPVTDKW